MHEIVSTKIVINKNSNIPPESADSLNDVSAIYTITAGSIAIPEYIADIIYAPSILDAITVFTGIGIERIRSLSLALYKLW